MFHRFSKNIADIPLPQQFNNPFRYTPHLLCRIAADEVKNYIYSKKEWSDELAEGKMFGVLVVEKHDGEVGYLAAFSGLLAGDNTHSYFVPAIFDMLSPECYFQVEQRNISNINREIEAIKQSIEYNEAFDNYRTGLEEIEKEIDSFRTQAKLNKELRHQKRASSTLTPNEEVQLIKESQFEKAELKRLTKHLSERELELKSNILFYEDKIKSLKRERKERSFKLQTWLFLQFRLYNAKGDIKDLIDIFSQYNNQLPPAGAGECAAPKLLQYAYANNLKPLQMAEFWVGKSPKGEIRVDGNFYPSCKGKCLPILTYMLEGLNIVAFEDNCDAKLQNIRVVYEDEYLLILDKPEGVLSVPGKIDALSVQDWVRNIYLKSNDSYVVHRLDMATSGLLIVAKSMEVYKLMQKMFASRRVAKEYIAIVEGHIDSKEGEINLPLIPDFENRPAQKVDYENGKEAITKYKVLSEYVEDGVPYTRISLMPITGRTHQLRVHMAHPHSLSTSIVGDEIYGTPKTRLMLHATSVTFTHPITNEYMRVEVVPPF